jgi:starch-binding outer membrane protein, SusD/RagB family
MHKRKIMNRLSTLLLAGCLALVAVGCDNLLEVEPQQSVTPELALETPEGLRAVYASVYNRIMHQNYYGQRLTIAGDALADNGVAHHVNSGRYQGEPVNSVGSGVGGWNRYLQINEINLVIKHVNNVGLPQAEATRIEGEMYFHRALAHHDLVKVYAYEPTQVANGFCTTTCPWDLGVIIRTEPTETIDDVDFRPRATVTEVYNQIEADLLRSIELFQVSDGRSRSYANLAAAQALLARVYLYWGRWADAETYATRAMDNTSATLLGPGQLLAAYQADVHGEAIFQLQWTRNEAIGVNESLAAILTPSSHYDLIPSEEFLATLGEGDARTELYPLDRDVHPRADDGPRFGFRMVAKYVEYQAAYADNVPVIRYPEMLLTRAEARAEQNNVDGALADLNRMREARGLEEFETAPADLIDEILLERRRELAFEGGHRWHDLKRRGMDIHKPASTNRGIIRFGESFQFLAQLPSSEVTLNPELRQNPGY